MAQDGIKCIAIAETDSQELIAFAKKQRLDWVFVGPEVPLLAGVVDDLQAANIQVFGPQKKGGDY